MMPGTACRKNECPPSGILPVELPVLPSMAKEELASVWQRQLGKTAPSQLPRSLLARSLAYQLQAQELGGLPRETVRILCRIADDMESDREVTIPQIPEKRIKPGSVLVREHGGTLHRVMVMAEGFAWEGKSYPSLSAVAKAITGTNWNGNTFFGIGKKSAVQRASCPEAAT